MGENSIAEGVPVAISVGVDVGNSVGEGGITLVAGGISVGEGDTDGNPGVQAASKKDNNRIVRVHFMTASLNKNGGKTVPAPVQG